MKAFLRICLGVGLLAACLLLATARPAAAAAPCWKTLLNDWYDGRIDNTYPIACYRQAIEHLPTDVQTYSSARDDIERALQSAEERNKLLHRPSTPDTLVPANGTKTPTTTAAATTTTAAGPASTTHTTTTATATGLTPTMTTASLVPVETFPGNRPKGGISSLADQLNPASPSSLPIPLLVLGGLAILLLAAGAAGLFAKRLQDRR